MKKYYYLLIAFLTLLTVKAQATHEYPLTDLDYNNLPSWITNDFGKGSLSGPTGQSRYTSEGIVLTIKRATTSAFAIDDLNLDLRKGAKFEFEYAMAIVNPNDAQRVGFGGGGMTFFIYEAGQSLSMGYLGSALGYSFNGSTASGSTAIKTGLNGAYLGIGFDLDGNNKERRGFGMGSYETREGLAEQRYWNAGYQEEFLSDLGKEAFGSFYKNHITLRGAGQGNQYKGNPLLLTKYFGGNDSGNNTAMATLDYNTGEYDFSSSDNGADFNIANGGFDYSPIFQKIEVELEPDGEEGMFVTIKGNGRLLIDRFYYKHSFKTYGDGKQINGQYVDYQYDYSTGIPYRVNIGFAATTMDQHTQKTIIRNVKVSPIDEGEDEGIELEDEYEEICISENIDSTGAVAFIDILKDTDYNVDWNSFKFVDKDGNKKGNTDDYFKDYYAEWEYDRSNRQVKMTVQFDYYKPQENLDIFYTVKIDGVESKPANILVKSIECGAIANPHIRVKNENEEYLP
ncbi:hypothetical protein HX049_06475 [Myroides odoratimimus]|uniref:hypothetical protein n=1 Tax=Myroides odoratimimus TaxID=76832 RepID=UPI002577D651|nr:hypothetical protein [Myroides odoratimimus]MDM1396816.1 hypothetical protein [Myroides odoratimimus]